MADKWCMKITKAPRKALKRANQRRSVNFTSKNYYSSSGLVSAECESPDEGPKFSDAKTQHAYYTLVVKNHYDAWRFVSFGAARRGRSPPYSPKPPTANSLSFGRTVVQIGGGSVANEKNVHPIFIARPLYILDNEPWLRK